VRCLIHLLSVTNIRCSPCFLCVSFLNITIYTCTVRVEKTAAELNCLLRSLIADVSELLTYLRTYLFVCVLSQLVVELFTCRVLCKSCKKLFVLCPSYQTSLELAMRVV